MFIAKVTGSLVATQKVASMIGHKMLVVEPYRVDPKDSQLAGHHGPLAGRGRYGGRRRGRVCVDHPRLKRPAHARNQNLPIDTVIIGIIDSVHVDQTCVYQKEGTRDGGRRREAGHRDLNLREVLRLDLRVEI